MMSPSVVLDRHGSVALVLGSGGSKRIRSAILAVLIRRLVHGEPLGQAVDAPRVHWDEDHTEAEPGLSPETLRQTRRLAPMHVWPSRSVYFGGVHAADPTSATGWGDPRRDGAAATLS